MEKLPPIALPCHGRQSIPYARGYLPLEASAESPSFAFFALVALLLRRDSQRRTSAKGMFQSRGLSLKLSGIGLCQLTEVLQLPTNGGKFGQMRNVELAPFRFVPGQRDKKLCAPPS
jgi:hypothetical protein